MSRRRFRPALGKRRVANANGYDVYTINAYAIRNAAEPDEEFGNVATHEDFPDLIPRDEIWTVEATYAKEGRFFIANAVAELESLAKGESKSDAFDAGVAAERRLREEITGIKVRDGRPHGRVPPHLRVRLFCRLSDDIGSTDVWLVDGCLVRSTYKTDYTEGGHGYVYPWVPKGEIWVEQCIDREELPYIIAHEYIEMRLMREKRLKYDRAHRICAEMEFDLRKGPSRAKFPGLSRRCLTKGDLPLLTKPEFFGYVEKNYVHSVLRRLQSLVAGVASAIRS